MATIIMQNKALINAYGHHIQRRTFKPVLCITNGKRFASVTDAAEAMGVRVSTMSNACTGKIKTCCGMEWMFVGHLMEKADKVLDHTSALSTALEQEKAKNAELERKAALWDAYEAEQNAIRKAEENRQQAIEKAKEKVARRQRMADRKEEEFKHALNRLHDAERELNALLNGKED